jgi:hypothetical protein
LNREARKGRQENRYFLRVLSGLRGKISRSFPRVEHHFAQVKQKVKETLEAAA